ncbi:MAG: hypothetical protein KGZ70_10800 [Hydrogenophaga sp.]|nr:hypothetical protein [Hydrogenophaga sp.]MBS3912289.1 hypothetical protein [Hydrogenophaga sp.]
MPNTPIDQIRTALAEVRGSGQTAVDIAALLTFLDSVEADAPADAEIRKLNHDSQLTQYKAEHERHLAYYKASTDAEQEMFKSVIETAKTALSTSILVNGGATVALLAFLGNLLAKSQPAAAAMQAALNVSIICFALGVLLGAAATGTTYCAQYCYHRDFRRSAVTFHVLTVVLILSTYIAFASGLIGAYHAFLPRGAA